MTDRPLVLVPLPGGSWLALEPEVFRQALVQGAALAGGPASAEDLAPDEPLLEVEELAAVLKLPWTWLEQAAKEHRIPSIQAGRWRRYRRSAVERALAANGKDA